MKKLLLFCSIMLCCLTAIRSQSLNASATTITSGGTVTVTGNGEGLVAYYSDLFISGFSVSSGAQGSVTGTISEFKPFNQFGSVPTSFKLSLKNTSTTPTTVFVRLTVTVHNDVSNTVRQFDQTINQVITVNPAGTQPTTYYNAARSQVFSKNDCGANSKGSSVTYTVTEGRYSSTISQADANNKAQNEINANGQAFANVNGTCTADYSKWITYTEYPRVSDTFAMFVGWNKDLVNTPTVRFEVYQNGVFKGVAATNVANNGATSLNIIQYLTNTGLYEKVKLKIISEADPNISAFSTEVDWWVD